MIAGFSLGIGPRQSITAPAVDQETLPHHPGQQPLTGSVAQKRIFFELRQPFEDLRKLMSTAGDKLQDLALRSGQTFPVGDLFDAAKQRLFHFRQTFERLAFQQPQDPVAVLANEKSPGLSGDCPVMRLQPERFSVRETP